jgi:hypothetical protein
MENTLLLKEQYSEFQRNYCHMLRHLKKNDGVYIESDINQINYYMEILNDLFKRTYPTIEELKEREENKMILDAIMPIAIHLKLQQSNKNI